MNHDEFKKRFLPFHPLIYRISYHILENRHDADDVSQEVFVKLWEQRHKLTSVHNDEAFVTTITKHSAIDLLRKNRQKAAQAIENNDLPYAQDEEERMDARNELASAMECMRQLPPLQREVLRLRHFADLPMNEIARATGQTESNVRQLLSRARRTMKEKLNRNEK